MNSLQVPDFHQIGSSCSVSHKDSVVDTTREDMERTKEVYAEKVLQNNKPTYFEMKSKIAGRM